VRKTVTVVFCDLVGSTALSDDQDPEVVRELMARYHRRLRTILERHGGSVEKFVGDALLGVFGIPYANEDDALRAVRAAEEMRAAVHEMGLETRIGINTGSVVSGEGETLVIGDAINVAARLQTSAEPGQVLIGEETERLVRDAVRVADVGPLELKGKRARVPAFSLREILPGASVIARREPAFVGRQKELSLLDSILARAESRTPQLVTVFGAAGIGKSRLTRQFLAGAGAGPRIVAGRCLPYGEGITYWPLGEIVRQVTGDDPRGSVVSVVGGDDADLVADLLAGAVSAGPEGGSPEEISWAARKLFEALARERPVIAVVDDIHWAEPAMLDLLEYIASFAVDVPLLVLCTARPELLEVRPSWSAPRLESTIISLAALEQNDAAALVGELGDVEPDRRAAIIAAAEGNPLFLEQLLAVRAERPGEEIEIPPTVNALIAARLDRLGTAERGVIVRGAVEGRVFHRGAVVALLDGADRRSAAAELMSLVRKDFIRPDRALFPGDDAFRFGHILIREVAYDSIPKGTRAELHERFAGWLDHRESEGSAALDEIVGYHLEQAARYLVELGRADPAVAERASERLGAAGRRALGRGDMAAASILLARAAELVPAESSSRVQLDVDRGEVLIESGNLREAQLLLAGAVDRSDALGSVTLNARARIGLANVQAQALGPLQETLEEIEPLAELLEEHGDHLGAADAHRLLARILMWKNDFEGSVVHAARALDHAQEAADDRRESAILSQILSTALWGPEPVERALVRCRAIYDAAPNRRVRASGLIRIGGLEGLAGRFDAARDAIGQARVIMDELGLAHLKAHSSDVAVMVEMLAGDYEAAEREARTAFMALSEMGDVVYQTSQAIWLSEALERQGRADEAEEWLGVVARLDPGEDGTIATVRARLALRRGDLEGAERLARFAVSRFSEKPVSDVSDAPFTLAEVHLRLGRVDEARRGFDACLRRYQVKGVVPLIQEAQAMLELTAR
jgi:class 3 adenylate cyclase